jgi:hypothetical protein
MSKIAIIEYCKKCPHFSYVFKHNYRDTDDFHCRALDKWLYGKVYTIHEDCPLENKISKRKMESYKRAEKVCQEFRYQMVFAFRENWGEVVKYLSRWMNVTGKIRYLRPNGKKDDHPWKKKK